VSLLTGKTVAFNLCGIGGKNCAIGVGTPSSARLLLLRREALELALYTFKYVGGVSNVVAILPPGRTTTAGTPGTLSTSSPLSKPTTKPLNVALLFLHDELRPWLDRPLAQTLPEDVPPTVAQMRSAPEAGLVEQITARGLFSQTLSQAQDGSNLIVLDPLPPSSGPSSLDARLIAEAARDGQPRIAREAIGLVARAQAERVGRPTGGGNDLLVAARIAQPGRRSA
jgi:hypothetical protein